MPILVLETRVFKLETPVLILETRDSNFSKPHSITVLSIITNLLMYFMDLRDHLSL